VVSRTLAPRDARATSTSVRRTARGFVFSSSWSGWSCWRSSSRSRSGRKSRTSSGS